MTHKVIESYRCSSGILIELYQFGRMYAVGQIFPVWGQQPECVYELSKAEAYQEFARIIESDVCDMVIG